MTKVRALVQSILDKVDTLLTTEPARLIGYGAAVVVFLSAQAIGYIKPGLLPAPVSFEDAIGDAFAALGVLVILVESIRRFVYSPQTYIEDLSDENGAGHEAAHMEEDLRRWLDAVKTSRAQPEQPSEAPVPEKVAIPVGYVPTDGKVN